MMDFCKHLELLSMFLSKKIGIFELFFRLIFDFTVHVGAYMSSGAEWTFRKQVLNTHDTHV